MSSFHRVSRPALGLAVLILLSATPSFAGKEVVLTCFPEATGRGNHRYVLEADLDCSAAEPNVIQLYGADRIELRGHTLTGAYVQSSGNAKIVGPGTITGSPGDGVRHTAGLLTVRDATISGNAGNGLVALVGKVKVFDSTIENNGRDGVAALVQARVQRSTVSGNGRFGVSTNTNPADACAVYAKGAIGLRDSEVTGNGVDAECGVTLACGDVATCDRAPKLTKATCDTSYRLDSGIPGETLGVCALD
jgi:hypothetical protein